MKTKIFKLNLAVVVFGALLFGYWFFLDEQIKPTLTFNNDITQYETDKKVYQPGEIVSVYVDFCKHRDVTGNSTWVLVDTIKLFYPEKNSRAPKGCYEGWVEAVRLPTIVDPGLFYLDGTSYQQINPIKRTTTEFKTEEFNIE